MSVLSIFFFIAVGTGSTDTRTETREHLGGDVVKTTITLVNSGDEKKIIYTGVEDYRGVRNGNYTKRTETTGYWTEEELTYKNGKRTGISKTTTSTGKVTYKCYKNNRNYPCIKAESINTENGTAFRVLADIYPWFSNELFVFGYDNNYVEAYMDTLETILDELGDDPLEFENYYSDAVDSLTYTPYDSIILLNYILSEIQGEEEVKTDVFRMATIDRHRSNGKTTYNILKTIYPGYLQSLSELEVSDLDFEKFCHLNDSLMDGDNALYGSLDREDIFFVDSVDARLFRAMVYILSYEDTTSSALKSLKIKAIFNHRNDIRTHYREMSSLLVQTVIDSTTQNAAGAALYFMLLKYYQGDMMYHSVKEAWLNKRDEVVVPLALTEFTGSNSATSVSLLGEVFEDGGAEVTSRGFVWADFYNPTTNDNTKTSGTGLGTFAVTLNDLTEGTTYYARSYATNSAGTAYGNCLTFTAGEAVGINESELFVQDFTIYPNPASGFTTISFHMESPENMALTFVNLKGQAVYHHDPGILQPGVNKIELDVSGLPNGLYSCQLSSNGRIKGTQKILVVH